MNAPVKPMLAPYQQAWLRDQSRLKLLVKSRRIGGSFVVALEDACAAAGIDMFRETYEPKRGVPQIIISASQAKTIEFLERVRIHLEALSYAIGTPLVARTTKTHLTLSNGVSCYALAANPRTIAGSEGDVTLDELGRMPYSKEIWAAAKAVADPTLGNRRGYCIRGLGTPLGDDNMFYVLAKTDRGAHFSRHFVDIHTAAKQGFPVDVEQCRLESADEDMFAQEYECVFHGADSRYISAELYDTSLYGEGERPDRYGQCYAGMDVARSPTGDKSAVQELRRIDDTLWDVEAESWRGVPWDEQERRVGKVLERCGRIAIDGTSIGNQFCERLTNQFGPSRVEAVEFTTAMKEGIATGLRLGLERRKLRLRRDRDELRNAVLSLRRVVRPTGRVTYDAARTKHGHADEAWALGLAVHAASAPISTGAVTHGTARTSHGARHHY